MKPIVPMEPKIAYDIPKGSEWIAQVKWDGVHVLTYYDGHETRLFNRKKNERTYHYPELLDVESYCKADSFIFDGEIIALANDGKPSFHRVMKRDGIRNFDRVASAQKQVSITYMIYDILFYNGDWMTKRPFQERKEILSNIVIPNDTVQLVSSHDDGESLFEAIKQHGMEGIVMKKLNSFYYTGEKKEVWLKIKNTRDLIAAVGGYTLRQGTVNAILIGLYDHHNNFIYIGHTGTGKMTASDWRNLTEKLLPLGVNEKPFVNKVERQKDAHWVKPTITVKIHYAEWPEGHSLRQPSIQAFVDVPASECVLTEEMQE